MNERIKVKVFYVESDEALSIREVANAINEQCTPGSFAVAGVGTGIIHRGKYRHVAYTAIIDLADLHEHEQQAHYDILRDAHEGLKELWRIDDPGVPELDMVDEVNTINFRQYSYDTVNVNVPC